MRGQVLGFVTVTKAAGPSTHRPHRDQHSAKLRGMDPPRRQKLTRPIGAGQGNRHFTLAPKSASEGEEAAGGLSPPPLAYPSNGFDSSATPASRNPRNSRYSNAPAATTVTRSPTDPSRYFQSTSSIGGGSPRKRERRCPGVTFAKILFYLAMFMVFAMAIIALVGGIMLYRQTGLLQVNAHFKDIAVGMFVLSGGLFVLFVTGCAAAASGNRMFAVVFILLLLGVIGGTIFVGLKSRRALGNVMSDLRAYWEALNDQAKSYLQRQWNCCGFTNPEDDPGSICPSGATAGCSAEIDNGARLAQRAIKISMFSSIGFWGLLILLIICISLIRWRTSSSPSLKGTDSV